MFIEAQRLHTEPKARNEYIDSIKIFWETSLVVQWLRIQLPRQWTWVPSLVKKLRSHMPWGNETHPPQLLSPPESQLERSPCVATKDPGCLTWDLPPQPNKKKINISVDIFWSSTSSGPWGYSSKKCLPSESLLSCGRGSFPGVMSAMEQKAVGRVWRDWGTVRETPAHPYLCLQTHN